MIGETTFEEIEDRRLAAALNDAAFRKPMPQSLVEKVMAIGNNHLPVHRQIPRWALIAASLVLMAGFVFAATIVVDAVTAKDDDRKGIQATEVTDGSDALAAPADVPCVSDVSSVPSTDNQPPPINNQQSTLKGEQAMTKRKAAATALTAAMAVAPLAAANGDEYQFIISGDPVAAETVDSRESASVGTALVTSMRTSPTEEASLEARYRTFDESDGIKLRTDTPKGMIISFK